MKKFINTAFTLIACFTLCACYSVYSGGTSGRIVDAESTQTPKEGIADVDIYAYTNESDRDDDFDKWTSGTLFVPQSKYYGHTTTGSNGDFTLSKMVWKSYFPDFGKDADVIKLYLLYYHENYGLSKGNALIVSDSTNDTVYKELTAVRKTTSLSLTFIDVATNSTISENLNVKINVPQENTSKEYKSTITGSGIISISYPRYASDGSENTPEIKINYEQSSDELTWKGCYNADNEAKDYSFFTDGFYISKTISGDSYSVKLYGKKCRPSVPVFEGQYKTSSDDLGSASDDGITVYLSSGTESYGSVQTRASSIGDGKLRHGTFSNLGSGYTWFDDTYTAKVCSKEFSVKAGSIEKTISYDTSMSSTMTIQLQ